MTKQLREQRDQRIAELHGQGLSVGIIAKRLGMLSNTAYKALQKLGLDPIRANGRFDCSPPPSGIAQPGYGHTAAHHDVGWGDSNR